MMMKKILITGVAGFIGYHLSKKLLNNNYHIIGIDNLNDYYNPFLKKDRLEILNELPKLKKLMDDQNLNLYIKKVIEFSFNANKYFNDQEPWSLKKSNPERMNTVIYNILNQIKSISILLNPIMPDSTDKILSVLGIEKKYRVLKTIENLNFLKSGNTINKSEILFKKIENDN